MGLKSNSDLPQLNKELFTEFKKQKALQFKESVFLYNPFTNCESVYSVYESGFAYTVTKRDANSLLTMLNNIWLQKNSREITEQEFKDFINQVTALQEQTHLLKPLTSFEDFVSTIRETYRLKIK